jgi:hypothetical protein
MLTPKARPRLFVLRKMLLLIFLCAISLTSAHARGSLPEINLREKDVRKGELIIRQLRRLEQLAAGSPDFKTYRALVNKIYPNLFVKVSELRDSDLKTDLTTAVFLYEEALQRLRDSNSTKLNCHDELRDIYAKACIENESKTAAELLWAKARLHTHWANAVIKYHLGIKDALTMAALEEIRRERQNDLALAERALAALKTLESDICAYSSLAEFEEQKALAKVSFERLSQEVSEVLRAVDVILQSLPRSSLFYPLYHARNSYNDGVFWWQKTFRQESLVVNANSFNETGEKLFSLDLNVSNYTVVINWRKAIRQTRQAENIIESLKIRL